MKRPGNVILRGETRLFLSILLAIILSVFAAANASAAPFAYVPNVFSNTVSVIDTATNAVVATLPVGVWPQGAAVNPSGTRVYVPNNGSGTVSVIDTSTNTVVATIPSVGNRPLGVAVNPSGTRVYVTDYHNGSTVSVIDTSTNAVVATIPVGSWPAGVAVNPSGTRAYVTNMHSATVSVIDTSTNAVVATIPVGSSPAGVAINPSGTRVYVTNFSSNTISVIDTGTNTVTAIVSESVGPNPHAVAVNPSGTRLYVTNYGGTSVSVIDTATHAVVATVTVGSAPAGVAVNPSDTRVYVTNQSSGNVSVVGTSTNTVVATITVGSGPTGWGKFIGPGVPVARWPGEGNANDVIGGHNGTLAGGVTFVPGRVGQAFKFDTSANSYITLPNSPDFMPASNQVTISAWIKPDFAVANGADIIFSKRDGCGSNRSYLLAVSKGGAIPLGYPLGTIVWSASVAGDDVTPSTRVPNDGQFHHIAGTYDGTAMRVYLDGVLIGEKPHTGPIPVTRDPPFIGLQSGCSGWLSAAVIDEIEFWNRALSASEMQSGWEVPADSTPPTTTDNAPSAWQKANFTVTLTCADNEGGSGCKETKYRVDGGEWQTGTSILISTEGDHLIDYYSVDNAGNQESAKSTHAKLDKTPPPFISFGAPSPPPNTNGWNNTNVSISFAATDNLSGVASTTPASPLLLTAEGPSVTGTVTVTDNAGNSSTFITPAVNIDKTLPTITASATAGGNPYTSGTWTNGNVIVSFVCSGGLSGLGSVSGPVTVSSEGANQSATGSCADNAGNSASAVFSGIKIDKTPPNAPSASVNPSPNGAGWNSTLPVTVSFASNGDLGPVQSGVTGCTGSTGLTVETTGTPVSGICNDAAGNTSATTSVTVKIDSTPPTVTYSGNAGTYTIDQMVSITCTAADALSGVASNTNTCANINGPAYTFTLGTNTFSARATDYADNVGEGSTSFTVQVTAAGLGNLVTQFVTKAGVANSMISKLNAAEAAAARGNAQAKAGAIGAFINELQAQAGKSLTAAQAATLIALAQAL